jgi:penicillin amidase
MKRFLWRLIPSVLVVGLLAIIGFAGWLCWRVRASLPVLDGTIPASGLSAQVEVLRDAHGVPHIRAQSLQDVLFAQGYVTAQDRLWQMDLSRRRAEGELSEIFGDLTLRVDIESRTLGLPRVAERALADLAPEERRLFEAYTRGVNTFIESYRDHLPLEFLMLRYQPKPWRALDSVAVALNLSTSLSQSWETDLMREHIAAKLNRDLFSDLFPDHSALDVPLAEIPTSVAGRELKTRNWKLETGNSKFETRDSKLEIGEEPESQVPCSVSRPAAQSLRAAGRAPCLEFPLPNPDNRQSAIDSRQSVMDGLGSNNWVVSGSHTQSGKPLLANDPHLGHSIPSVWYMIHLKAPNLDVTGVSLPGLPFVIIGHNQHIAWGATNTGPDVQDLYMESFNFRDPSKYLHNGQWVEAEVREENVRIRNQRDYHFTVGVTRHGPVISHDGSRDLALQWTLLSPHAIGFPFRRIDQAHNWQEFTAALRDFKVPMQNYVYADREGNIGFYAAGLVPIRRQGNGTMPVPGSSDDYDWTGFIPFEDLPHAYNPPSGILATANGRIVPDNYPYFITAKWEAPFRTARIFQLLRKKGPFTASDMLRIQTDILTLEDQWLATQLLAAAAKQPPSSPEAQWAVLALKNWDGEARVDSAATLILEVTRRALLTRILKPKLGDDLSGYRWPMSAVFLQNVLDYNLTRWLPPGDADFNMTLMRSLDEGIRQIPAIVHSQSHAAWKWGDTIPLTFHHPLSSGLPFLGRFLDVGPFPQAGTGTTVKQTTSRIGPSMRMVVDFSDFDQSMQNITLGESGQPFSPYYHDQFPAWYSGQSFPMLFSDEAVKRGTVHQLVLEPGR